VRAHAHAVRERSTVRLARRRFERLTLLTHSLDAGTITHISVPNLQETLKVALAAGATIVTPETPVETYGSYVTLRVCSCEP